MRVLVLNCGSSSLKHALFDVGGGAERELARGAVERIGQNGASPGPPAAPDHAAAVRALLDGLEQGGSVPDAVGHRVVHGGAEHTGPALIDAPLVATLRALVPFAPLHLPAEIASIGAVAARWADRPQVACFDTAFHRTLPEVAQRYALPEHLHKSGVRRYGFHGLSYEYVVGAIGARELGRAVLAHLGSGASMVAVREGRAIDTTMGFTPSGGLVMGTRAGDLDPGLLVYLAEHGHDAPALDELVNRRAGLLALSGTTADVRELLARRDGDPRAALALDVFAWSARKWVGAMAAAVGGVDTLVFTGGIGEHAAPIRGDIARGLDHLGVRLDDARNARGDAIISADGASCTVRVVSTDEERMVARHTARTLSGLPAFSSSC
jgi:acetate kinase